MKNKLFALLLVLTLLFGLTTSATAQSNYSFQLTNEVVQVYLNQDGTMALDYLFTFANDPGAHAIDAVDLGLPNSNYDFGSITADVNGSPVRVTTNYQGSGGSGVALELGSKQITRTGTVHAYVGRIERMFYPDSNDDKYASSEFSPTYFGSQYVHGSTDLTVIFHLPPGVKPDEPRYHPAQNWPGNADPTTGLDNDGRVTYTWQSPNADGSSQYTFGASFPASYIPDSAIVRTNIFDLIFGAIAAFFSAIGSIFPFCCFAAFFFGIPIAGAIGDRKRKLQYIKPSISIEGHGIKRGLTAVEAAILMGQPLDKVMTMILFSTTKKGALQVVTKDPLKVELLQPQPEGLQTYETEFVQAMVMDDRARRKALQTMTINLVKSVTEKMKGFSSKETVEYYKSINDKAWQQIESAGTPEIKSQMFDEAVEWTMLDKDYDDRSRRVFTGPIFMPMWWGRYDPVYRQSSFPRAGTSVSSSGSGSSFGGSSGKVSLPGADFAASVVGGVQAFSGRVLGNVNDFTSGVTNVTNPPPPPSRSGGGYRGGGGGCACACACAGCACACAGGGR